MFPKSVASACVCFSFLLGAAQAQNIFVLPGSNSINSSVQVLTPALGPVTTVTAGSGAFKALAKPDGSKYYIIANSGSQTVTVLDASFSNPKAINLGLQATGAVLTPDGRRLLVAAGSLHVIDTVTDNDLTPNGILPGTPITDVVMSLDGTRAFLLATTASGSGVVYAVDPNNGNISGNLAFNNILTSISVGPNGLLYVGGINRFYEINPTTLTLTPAGEIQLNARPGRPAFTPDGKYVLIPNLTPATGSSAILVDLNAHTVATLGAPLAGTVFDRIFVIGNNVALAYAGSNSSVYQLAIPQLAIAGTNFQGVPAVSVTSAATSTDIPGGTHATVQNLFLVSAGNLVKIDLAGNSTVGAVPVTVAGAQAISVVGPAVNNGSVATILTYGDKQGLAQGAVSQPLVVQVLDANGNPLNGIPVTFSTTAAGAVISNPSATTSSNGYAATTLTAPATSGPVVVTVTAGGVTNFFALTVGSTSGGTPTGGLAIVAGNGQLVYENNNTGIAGFGSPLIVKITDVNGAPVAGAPVTFSISSGPGSVSSPSGGGTPTPDGKGVMVATDSNGLASAAFLSSTIPPFSGYVQTTIQASAPGTNSANLYISTLSRLSPPTVQYVSPGPGTTLTGGVGATLKGAVVVKVVSSLGQPIPNVNLRVIDPSTWNGDPTSAPPSTVAACLDPAGLGVLTDATGTGTCDLTLIGKVGNNQPVLIDVGYQQANSNSPINLVITQGAPAAVKVVNGDKQSGVPGQKLPTAFSVVVTDAANNPIANAPVSFQVVTPGTITLSSVSSATDQNGRASALGTLGSIAGNYQIKVTAGTASTTFNFTVNIPATGIQPVSGGNQTTLINTAFPAPLVVKVVNGSGAPVAGIAVTFSVSGGSAAVGTGSATTDANGQAQTTVTAGPTAGPITVTASASGFSTSFALTSLLPGPTNVSFVNGASFQPGISPGSIVTIRGAGLLPGIQGLFTTNSVVGPLPTSFKGFGVTFNGIAAPIYNLSNQNGQEQVTVQVPYEVTPGTATVLISAVGGGTATLMVPVQAVSPGFFETQYNGQNFAVAIRPDGSYVSPANPAGIGEVVCLFTTGAGPMSPAASTGSSGIPNQNVLDPVDVGLNNSGVRLVSATGLVGLPGVQLVCLQVPQDPGQAGPRQPVGLIVHDPTGDVFAPGTFIPIQ